MDLTEYLSERHRECSPPEDIGWTHKFCRNCGEIIKIETPVCECGNLDNFCDPGGIESI